MHIQTISYLRPILLSTTILLFISQVLEKNFQIFLLLLMNCESFDSYYSLQFSLSKWFHDNTHERLHWEAMRFQFNDVLAIRLQEADCWRAEAVSQANEKLRESGATGLQLVDDSHNQTRPHVGANLRHGREESNTDHERLARHRMV